MGGRKRGLSYFFSKMKKTPGVNFGTYRRYYLVYNETTTKGGIVAKRYAIQVKEENLDLLEILNQGVRPAVENDDRPSIFVFTSDKTTPAEIKLEDDLYDKDGHSVDSDIVWL